MNSSTSSTNDNEIEFLDEQMKKLGIRHNWQAISTLLEQLKAENGRLTQERDNLLNQVQTLNIEKEKIFVDTNEYGQRFVKDLEDKHTAKTQKLKDEHYQELRKQQEQHEKLKDEHYQELKKQHEQHEEHCRDDEEVQSLVQKFLPSSNITDAVFQNCVSQQEAAQHREAFTIKELEAVERKLQSRIAKRVAWETVVDMIKQDYQHFLEIQQQKNALRDLERDLSHKKQRLNALSAMSRCESNADRFSPTTTASSTPTVSSASTPKTAKTPTLKKILHVVSDDDDEDEQHMAVDDSQSKRQFSFNFAGK